MKGQPLSHHLYYPHAPLKGGYIPQSPQVNKKTAYPPQTGPLAPKGEIQPNARIYPSRRGLIRDTLCPNEKKHMEGQGSPKYRIAQAVACDLVLRAVANGSSSMASMGDGFAASGFAAKLESNEFRKRELSGTIVARVSRGNARLLTDPQSALVAITRNKGPIGLFVDGYDSQLMLAMEQHKKRKLVKAVALAPESWLFYSPAKEQQIQGVMGTVRNYARLLVRGNTITKVQVEARHRLFYSLGFEEDDILAAVYLWFNKSNKSGADGAYNSAVHGHDLFGKEIQPAGDLCPSVEFQRSATQLGATPASAAPPPRPSLANNEKKYQATPIYLSPEKVVFKKPTIPEEKPVQPPSPQKSRKTVAILPPVNEEEEKEEGSPFGIAYLM